MKARKALLVSAALAWASVAQGEVLEITGEFPAGNREASFLESVSVDRFGGSDGAALQIAIERALGGSQFEVLGGRAGRDTAQGSISGSVTSDVEEMRYRRKQKQCVQKGERGKCLKEEQVEVTCRRKTVSVRAEIRVVRNTDGRILYSQSKPSSDDLDWCPGDEPDRSVEGVIDDAILNIARSLRGDLVPHVDTYKVRVRENTKGLSKDSADRFKDLVKLTKRDQESACSGWAAMQAEAAGHPSLLFNLGLCAEQRGAYEDAIRLYQDAVRAGANEGREGVDRANRLIAGREDARERAKRRRNG